MTWSKSNVMEEKLKFVARMLDSEKMAGLFGISPKTGYKIWERYKDVGLEGGCKIVAGDHIAKLTNYLFRLKGLYPQAKRKTLTAIPNIEPKEARNLFNMKS